jgi:hypothetical protein
MTTTHRPLWMPDKADLSATPQQRRDMAKTMTNVGQQNSQPSGIANADNIAAWSGRASHHSAMSERGRASAGRESAGRESDSQRSPEPATGGRHLAQRTPRMK